MTTFAEIIDGFRTDLRQRYKSHLWLPIIISLAIVHWQLVVHLLFSTPSPKEVITLVSELVSAYSVITAFLSAAAYVVLFPWAEYVVHLLSSTGRRTRADAQADEVEQILARRKIASQRHAQIVESELNTREKESRISDIELAKTYQSLLPGEQLSRGTSELKDGIIGNQFEVNLMNYVSRADHIEGRFVNSAVQIDHQNLCTELSALTSAISQYKNKSIELDRVIDIANRTITAQQAYRTTVRAELGI